MLRRRTTTAFLAAVFWVFSYSIFWANPATADPQCYVDALGNLVCKLSDSTSGAPGSTAPNSPNGGSGSTGTADNPSSGGSDAGSAPIGPCEPGGSDIVSVPLNPPPDASSSLWAGNDPSTGSIYQTSTCSGDMTGTTFFVPNGQAPSGGAAPPPVDPAVLAQQLLSQVVLSPPKAVTQVAAAGTPVINQPIWFWIDGGDQTVLGPQTSTATAGAVAVTMTATLQQTVWSLGDGQTLTCNGPGSVYPDPSLTDEATARSDSPTCGYRYPHSSLKTTGSVYTVTMQSVWQLSWHGGGKSGVVTRTVDGGASPSFPVIEVAALNNG